MSIDFFNLIPQEVKQKALDTIVDVISSQAKKLVSDELGQKIQGLRSDAAFRKSFDLGFRRALQKFIDEYEFQDEDMVDSVTSDMTILKNSKIQESLISMIRQPDVYLNDSQVFVDSKFNSILPSRKNRERVNKAIYFLLKCIAQEVWHLPELAPIYLLHFQRITAEVSYQQVLLQKEQIKSLNNLNENVQNALIRLTDELAYKYPRLTGNETQLLPMDNIYHNLPNPDYLEFIGREQELERLEKLLSSKERAWAITIDGIGGVGKSALALEIAYRYLRHNKLLSEDERFDAIVWVSAKQSVLTGEGIAPRPNALKTINDIYTVIAATLEREDIIQAKIEEQDELVRKVLTQQRTLLVIDNLETIDDDEVLAFLRELPLPTKAIITTRHRIDVAHPIRLVGMLQNDAMLLIEQECKQKDVNLTNAESVRLYNHTGGIPLAIVWSIAQMGFGYEVESVLSRLGEPNNDVVRFCFEAVVEKIRGQPSHKLLMALSLFVKDASREALGYVTDYHKLDRDEGLIALEKLSLINKRANRFSLLPLTKTFAFAELKRNPDFEESAQKRWIGFLMELCKGADTEYHWRYRNYDFLNEAEDIFESIHWSYQHGKAQNVFLLTLAAYYYLEFIGDWNKILVLCGQALILAESIDDALHIARFSNVHAIFYLHYGEYEKARKMALPAIDNYRRVNNRVGEAISMLYLSSVYRKFKQFDKAKQITDMAWEIANEIGDDDLKATVNTNYGKLARDMGNWELAWKYFSDVRDYFEAQAEQTVRDETLARSSWGHLAYIATQLGRPKEAKELCLRSLEYFEISGTKSFLVTLKYRLALAEEALGENELALKHVNDALKWFERLGMKPDVEEAKLLIQKLS